MTFNKFGILIGIGSGVQVFAINRIGTITVFNGTGTVGVMVGIVKFGTFAIDVATRKVSNAEYFGSTVLNGRYGTNVAVRVTRGIPVTCEIKQKRFVRTFRKFGKSAA